MIQSFHAINAGYFETGLNRICSVGGFEGLSMTALTDTLTNHEKTVYHQQFEKEIQIDPRAAVTGSLG